MRWCLVIVHLGIFICRYSTMASACAELSPAERKLRDSARKLCPTDQSTVIPRPGGKPLTVGISILIVKLDDIKALEESYTTDLFIRKMWNDSTLCHDEKEEIIYPADTAKNFWSPDVYFVNALKSSKHDAPRENSYLKIFPNGSVITSERITVTAKCIQDLTYFPADKQQCTLIIESYSYTTKHLLLKWDERSPAQIADRKMPKFIITNYTLSHRTVTYSTGNFFQLMIHFNLERRFGYYLIQVYIPCIFVVLLSLLTFWICPDDTGDRVALGITSVLALIFLLGSINANLPKVSYAKSIDYYLITCFLFVSSVVLAAVFPRRTNKKLREGDEKKDGTSRPIAEGQSGKFAIDNEAVHSDHEDEAARSKQTEIHPAGETKMFRKTKKRKVDVDLFYKILFPLIFFLLNVVYMGWMLGQQKHQHTHD